MTSVVNSQQRYNSVMLALVVIVVHVQRKKKTVHQMGEENGAHRGRKPKIKVMIP